MIRTIFSIVPKIITIRDLVLNICFSAKIFMISAKYFLIEIKYFFRDNNIFQRQLNSRKKSKKGPWKKVENSC
jgi:hypothetical protein